MTAAGGLDLGSMLEGMSAQDLAEFVETLPPTALERVLEILPAAEAARDAPVSPLAQAQRIDEGYVERPHLKYISDRITRAVEDVEAGRSRRLIIELPPRSGKTTLTTLFTPAWILQRHPEWPVVLTSHDGNLATSWGRQIRRWAEEGRLGVDIARDAGAVSEWETTEGGSVTARSVRASLTGRGAKVLIVDDPHKDFVDAHSVISRQQVWDWWLSVAQTRLEPPTLIIVIATRWHEDDLIGRLLSPDYPGDTNEWEEIRLPAIAEDADILGRAPGDALLSPIIEETPEEAVERVADVRRSVGTYTFSALYQQRPSPAEGTIFDASWWRYWTVDPGKATEDGRVVHFEPESSSVRSSGTWVESWDFSFKGGDSSDFVVGQRWVRHGTGRYLLAQVRGRFTFTQTLREVRAFSAAHVPTRLVEEAANGAAVIDTLRREVGGLIPVTSRDSKEARARAVSPEIEAGDVYLPHPTDPGNEWVADLLSEVRNFPNDAHDDQVDSLTQALARLRSSGRGSLSRPSVSGRQVPARDSSGSVLHSNRGGAPRVPAGGRRR